jgi:uncharacterized protein (TIGR02246 family)
VDILDEDAVRAVEAAYDEAWNAADVAAMMRLFTADASVVDPTGRRSDGRTGIEGLLAEFLRGQGQGSRHSSKILDVRFASRDVAVVDGEASIEGLKTKDGGDRGALRHRFTDILVATGQGWRIAHVRAYVFMSQPL